MGTAIGTGLAARHALASIPKTPASPAPPRADAVILIWLAGGLCQQDTLDPKGFTPFEPGMRGNQLRSTCPSVPTAIDGVEFAQGLEHLASVMDLGTVVRTITDREQAFARHVESHYLSLCGHRSTTNFKPPTMGSVVARALGSKAKDVPAFVNVGRGFTRSQELISSLDEAHGPGFYGPDFAPFVVPDASMGAASLSPPPGFSRDALDRRMDFLHSLHKAAPEEIRKAEVIEDYLRQLDKARNLMDSPMKRAFDYKQEETPETLAAYDNGHVFSEHCLFARRLVEQGTRFVMVEFSHGETFRPDQRDNLFDQHHGGGDCVANAKSLIDKPIAQLVRDLEERGLLDSTLVVVATEFGRTILGGSHQETFDSAQGRGENHTISDRGAYGYHGHFQVSGALLFGGGMKRGYAHGSTAAEHPMLPIEDEVKPLDFMATIYDAVGIAPDTSYIHEGRPIYVTDNAEGQPIEALYA
jgi:hypothetical protein